MRWLRRARNGHRQGAGPTASAERLDEAVQTVRVMAEEAHADIVSQVAALDEYTLDGRNYRALWRHAGTRLRSPLFTLPCGLHPHVQLTEAVAVIAADPRR